MRSKQLVVVYVKQEALAGLGFSLFIRVSSESQSFCTIESIVEIKQILHMNASKNLARAKLVQHEVSPIFFRFLDHSSATKNCL